MYYLYKIIHVNVLGIINTGRPYTLVFFQKTRWKMDNLKYCFTAVLNKVSSEIWVHVLTILISWPSFSQITVVTGYGVPDTWQLNMAGLSSWTAMFNGGLRIVGGTEGKKWKNVKKCKCTKDLSKFHQTGR